MGTSRGQPFTGSYRSGVPYVAGGMPDRLDLRRSALDGGLVRVERLGTGSVSGSGSVRLGGRDGTRGVRATRGHAGGALHVTRQQPHGGGDVAVGHAFVAEPPEQVRAGGAGGEELVTGYVGREHYEALGNELRDE